MLGFFIGTACLVALIKVLRFGRRGAWAHHGACAHGYGGVHEGPGGFGRWGSPWRSRWGRGGRFFLQSLLWRLDTTPGQEKVITSAIDDVRKAADAVRGDARAARPELAQALRQDQFDETLFGELSHKADEAARTMRRAVVDALAKIHAVLDEKQRRQLADLVERGGFGRWSGPSGGGPYRGAASL